MKIWRSYLSRLQCSQVPETLSAQHCKTLSSLGKQSLRSKRNRVLHKCKRDGCNCVLDLFSSGFSNFRSPALCCGRGSGFGIRRATPEFKLYCLLLKWFRASPVNQVSISSSVRSYFTQGCSKGWVK